MSTPTPDLDRSGRPFDEWENLICQTFVPLQARSPGDADIFRGGVVSAALGTVTMAEVTASHAVVERTPRLIRQEDPEFYKFGLQVTGSCIIEQDNREAQLSPGDLAIYDTSRPYRIRFGDDFHMIVAMFPRHLVHLPANHMATFTAVRLVGDQGLAALLSPLMRGLSADVAPSGGGIATHLGDAVVDLVTAAFAEQMACMLPVETSPGRRALMEKVYRFIDENLQDPDLSSQSIAAAHFTSVRRLQKAFQDEGASVAAMIRERRLERCRRELSSAGNTDDPIALIAARWGFLDAAHFSRLFRSAYGYSPREYRSLHRPS